MASKVNKETRAIIGENAADKIGTYDEAPGGGTPIRKGEKFEVADTPEEAEEIKRANPKAKVRVNQPRNPDGQFGYNSQNARKLKYGPSRGTTVPHFLRDVDLNKVLEKGTVMVMDGPNGIRKYISTIEMTKEQLIENAKHFIEETGGLAGMHEGAMVDKKGRTSKKEKDVAAKGGGIAGKVDLNKIADSTKNKMKASKVNYDTIEKGLSGSNRIHTPTPTKPKIPVSTPTTPVASGSGRSSNKISNIKNIIDKYIKA